MGPENEIDTAEFAQDAGSSGTERPQPFSSLVRVDFGAISDVGKVRTNNEDHFRIARTSRTMRTLMSNLPPGQVSDYFEDVAYSMVVADGMGGEAAGEVASMMAITIGVKPGLVVGRCGKGRVAVVAMTCFGAPRGAQTPFWQWRSRVLLVRDLVW